MAAAAEEPRKRKKRKHDVPAEPHGESTPPVGMVEEDGEDIGDKPKKKYPHPAKDESLSEQAVKGTPCIPWSLVGEDRSLTSPCSPLLRIYLPQTPRRLEVQQGTSELAHPPLLVHDRGALRCFDVSLALCIYSLSLQIPDDYIPLLKKYLKNLQGGAREVRLP